jgi:hypothetical protein
MTDQKPVDQADEITQKPTSRRDAIAAVSTLRRGMFENSSSPASRIAGPEPSIDGACKLHRTKMRRRGYQAPFRIPPESFPKPKPVFTASPWRARRPQLRTRLGPPQVSRTPTPVGGNHAVQRAAPKTFRRCRHNLPSATVARSKRAEATQTHEPQSRSGKTRETSKEVLERRCDDPTTTHRHPVGMGSVGRGGVGEKPLKVSPLLVRFH